MSADVVETTQFALNATDQQKRLTGKIRGKEIAGLRQLRTMPNHLPGPGEDSFLLLCEHARVGVTRCGKRPCARNVAIDLNGWLLRHRSSNVGPQTSDFGRQTSASALSKLGLRRLGWAAPVRTPKREHQVRSPGSEV